MVMAQCNETTSYYHNLIPEFFQFIRKVDQDSFLYQNNTYKVKPAFPVDMSCHWKVTGMGGAAKDVNLFCHLCLCESCNIARYQIGDKKCDWCMKHSFERCYCHEVETYDVTSFRKREIFQLERKYLYFTELDKDKKMHVFFLNPILHLSTKSKILITMIIIHGDRWNKESLAQY